VIPRPTEYRPLKLPVVLYDLENWLKIDFAIMSAEDESLLRPHSTCTSYYLVVQCWDNAYVADMPQEHSVVDL
jgi:hypothetical protein